MTVLVKLHEIKPYENNPRNHPVKQLEAITNSIKRFGFRGSILLDRNNVIVAGHARYEAASVAGLSEIPCEYADDLTDEEIKAYRILDNKIAAMSFDDNDKLQLELAALPDFDFSEFGVEFPEIEQLPNEGLCDDDETPKLKIEATTKRGDIWLLGNHRLMCGDSTLIDDVEKLMNGEKADLLVTDPPYGVSYTEKNKYLNSIGKPMACPNAIENDSKKPNEMNEFWLSVLKNLYIILSDKSSYYIFSPQGGDLMMMMMAIGDAGFQLKHMLIWVKNNHVLGRCDYHYKHEPILYGWKKDGTHEFYGNGQFKTSVWTINKPFKNDLHPTMKPVELIEECLLNSSEKNENVIDVFGGSGSTLIACEKTNRKCFMMELAPNYCDVIIKRWQKFTGKQAILESTQQLFDEVANG